MAFVTSAVTFLLAAGLLTACTKAPQNEEALMKAGLDALNVRNDPQEAIGYFRTVLLQNPNHYPATIQYALALDGAGKLGAARRAWTRVRVLAKLHRDRATLARANARLGGPIVIGGAGPTEEAAMKAGLDALYGRGDPEAAAVEFQRVLALDPDHYSATFQLARALDQAGRRAEADPLWQKLLLMAEQYHDQTTSVTARTRLSKRQ